MIPRFPKNDKLEQAGFDDSLDVILTKLKERFNNSVFDGTDEIVLQLSKEEFKTLITRLKCEIAFNADLCSELERLSAIFYREKL